MTNEFKLVLFLSKNSEVLKQLLVSLGLLQDILLM